jgi:hypothetical protein
MPLISRFKVFLYYRALNKFRSTHLSKVKPDHFSKIRRIAIVFDPQNAEHRNVIKEYKHTLEEAGIQVSLFGYLDTKNPGITFDFPCIDQNSLSFAWIPKGQLVADFISTPFDVLINLDQAQHKPVNYICAASQAFFKIGPARGDSRHYDLMIDMQGNDIRRYLDEMRIIFNKIVG